ncbi:hypothetical protein SAMN05428642_10272 [Flaviramulus basaltis]|uniref:Cytochrome c domain-containing protein n=1 Tax=Flaviramulus basaltis TaxID=369401 RepID=A0A1K2IGA3_9FLAO|nr:c-type cytochrome [Flaviramulus basaltis]SFZ91449.1 hypothetical protein SAMN05428642_10272 [Flaviramulus basaltis]
MKTILYFTLLILIFVGCKNSEKENYTTSINFLVEKTQTHPGEKLMKAHCYACHNATTSEENRVAPPMIAIKKRYIFKDTSKEEFINDMQQWIKNPTEENAKMYGAVKRFGIMSKMYYPENIIEKIADYMYDNEIEQPEWFEEHYKENRGQRFKK